MVKQKCLRDFVLTVCETVVVPRYIAGWNDIRRPEFGAIFHKNCDKFNYEENSIFRGYYDNFNKGLFYSS